MTAPAPTIHDLSPAEIEAILAWPEKDRAALRYRWPFWRRPDQTPPIGDWDVWTLMAGRGAGKTRVGSEQVRDWAESSPGCRIALLARTAADVRDVMIEGESGILAVCPPAMRPLWVPSKRRIEWPNGSRAYSYVAVEPSQLRGPQHHFAWVDELAAFPTKRDEAESGNAFDNLRMGLRLGRHPRIIVTTTPRPTRTMRGLLKESGVVVTKASTWANMSNLAEPFRKQLQRYIGTRLGRQELDGDMLEDAEGALWTLALIERQQVQTAPELSRILVGVDPSATSDGTGDEVGIIVVGQGVDGHAYTLADRSGSMGPSDWARRIVETVDEWKADAVVVEVNQGGGMVQTILRQIGFRGRIIERTAKESKSARAEPIAALWEQGLAHHVGTFPKLEDQMRSMTPSGYEGGGSPDRLDAYVWTVAELALKPPEPDYISMAALLNPVQGPRKFGGLSG